MSKAVEPTQREHRPQPPNQSNLTKEQKEQKRQDIIQSAPLQTNPDDATNPHESTPTSKKAPWREGAMLPADQLMNVRLKTSINQPQEHVLRLTFLAAERNKNRGYASKTHVSDLINEAVEKFTKQELKKLGHDV